MTTQTPAPEAVAARLEALERQVGEVLPKNRTVEAEKVLLRDRQGTGRGGRGGTDRRRGRAERGRDAAQPDRADRVSLGGAQPPPGGLGIVDRCPQDTSRTPLPCAAGDPRPRRAPGGHPRHTRGARNG